MNEEQTVKQIISHLRMSGFEAFIAGGAVRDWLAGEIPSDYDVVTNASYGTVRELFHDRKLAVVGISFKICIVDGIEVATYRKDGSFGVENQNGMSEQAESIHQDLARRDLTINAMAYCPITGQVVDDFGGQEDLKKSIIRFTGMPHDRIIEDPCRILRACRFKVKIKGEFAPDTFLAMRELGYKVAGVAPERLRMELMKALKLDHPSDFFHTLHDVDILSVLSPGLDSCYGHDGGRYHGETLDVHMGIVGDSLPARKPLLRLAGYLHDIGKPVVAQYEGGQLSFYDHEKKSADMVEHELHNLKFSVKDVDYVKNLVMHHMRSIHETDKLKTVRRTLKKLFDDGVSWKDWMLLKIADTKGNLNKADLSIDQIKGMIMTIRQALHPQTGNLALSIQDLAVNGLEVMTILGLKQGPEVGRILEKVLSYVLDDPERNVNGCLVEFIQGLKAE